jgi:hypothetical protein
MDTSRNHPAQPGGQSAAGPVPDRATLSPGGERSTSSQPGGSSALGGVPPVEHETSSGNGGERVPPAPDGA